MINVANLLSKTSRIPGNYFASNIYIKGDLELGLLENRKGDRLLALPEVLIKAIYQGIETETGDQARLVLFNCGKWWGKSFYVRFCEDLSEYYGKAISDMEMIEFIQCLKQCWKTHGWGVLEFDTSYYQQGFLLVTISHSPFAEMAGKSDRPVCYIEAGILSSFFSQLTGRDLHCVQTACQTLGAESNYFILGLLDRLSMAETMVEKKQDHDAIMLAIA